jgi:poly-gamma-glutamate synthesis protein (capsule biosynthesis protein)
LDADGRIRLSDEPVVGRALFAGDLCPIHRIEAMLAADDVDAAFGDTRGPFRRVDLAVVNLESPLCADAAPIDKLGPNFRARPAVAAALADAPVHVACMANNHSLDQGPGGLLATLDALDAAGIAHVGAGRTPAEARSPLAAPAGEVEITLLNVATLEGAVPRTGPGAAAIRHFDDLHAVAVAAAAGRTVVPVVHTGKEQVLFPSPHLQGFCRALVDAGAAAVVCHHPHVPQGLEVYRGAPIAYSLGNFLFDWHEPEPETDSSFLLELGFANAPAGGRGGEDRARTGAAAVAEMVVHPFARTDAGGIALLQGGRRADYLGLIADLSRPLRRPDELRPLWQEQCRALYETWYRPRLRRGEQIDSDDPAARRRAQLTFLNLLGLDEHGVVAQEALHQRVTGCAEPHPERRRTLDALMARLRSFATN